MNRAEEEVVLRITAEYVAEVQAGHEPHLGDYMARYPEYADAIAEFVAYYHAIEVDLSGEAVAPRFIVGVPQLSEGSSTALERAWGRIQGSGSDRASAAGQEQARRLMNPPGSLPTLFAIASKRHLSLAELAVKAGLSQDIIEKLGRRSVAASTLPLELLRRFATLLQQPLSVIAVCFDLSDQSQVGESANIGASMARARVAEARSTYEVEGASSVQAQSFREAVEQSEQLSDEQKDVWRDILSREGL